MSEPVIKVENLSKRYRIGAKQQGYRTFRETLVDAAKAPFQRLSNLAINSESRAKQFEEIWALKDVSFEVNQGDVLGIIGRNGAGKSTLLKILSKITEPTEGRIKMKGRVGSLLEVGTGFNPELTGHENVYLYGAILGMDRWEVTRKFDEIVAFAELDKFMDTPVKRYSSGMYMRLAFAVAAHLEAEILFVDEVLAVGDAKFRMKCMGKMSDVSGGGRTIFFVSHDMSAIEYLCPNVMVLSCGKIIYRGKARDGIEKYFGSIDNNTMVYEEGSVRSIGVQQVDNNLEIEIDYVSETPLKFPCLGFVISDYIGRPIFGGNPKINHISEIRNPTKVGNIKCTIEAPKLINGRYGLSVWFGDGVTDTYIGKDVLQFDIVNMTEKRQLDPVKVGYVVPNCKWEFNQERNGFTR